MRTRKSKGVIEAELALLKTLQRVGYSGRFKDQRVNEIPNYSVSKSHKTSDVICSNGSKKPENIYSGSEILGIAVMHKSNLVPVRRDSNDAVDISSMRR